MKKFRLSVLLFIACFHLSCEKNEEAIPEKNLQQEAATLPHYDETNSVAITWDQLPEQLRNAIPLEGPTAPENARVAISSYSYYIGPFGGGGGGSFTSYPPDGSKIYAMAIRSGDQIDKLTVWYKKSDGTIYLGVNAGGNGGAYYLQFFSDDEYIHSVTGRAGSLVDYLRFNTNKKGFGYGSFGGSPFYVTAPKGYQILGFNGRSGKRLDRIGFMVYTQ